MNRNCGKQFEREMINFIHGKRYPDLPNNLKHFVGFMFENINPDDVFIVEACDPRGKADIKVTLGKEKHYVSLKTGGAKIVHNTHIRNLIIFLRNYGISNETLKTILRFQFGDGTLNGTGTKRLDYAELFPMMAKEIYKANQELNKNIKLVSDLCDYLLFIGTYGELPQPDYMYHGNLDYGVIASRIQFSKHIYRKALINNYSFLKNLHIGPIIFRPYARYVNKQELNPEKRYQVEFEWVNLYADIEFISKRYDG